jgi:hypothetical protein
MKEHKWVEDVFGSQEEQSLPRVLGHVSKWRVPHYRGKSFTVGFWVFHITVLNDLNLLGYEAMVLGDLFTWWPSVEFLALLLVMSSSFFKYYQRNPLVLLLREKHTP